MTHQRLDAQTLQEVLDAFKKFAAKHFPQDKRLQWDREERFPEEIIKKMVSPEVGLHLLFLPESYGGLGGGAYDIYRMSEEMSKTEMGIATAFLAISLGTDPLRVGGTEEQKKKWLTRIAEEGLIVAYGATEPGAGSDLAALKTQARPVLDEQGKTVAYRIDGVKQFITNGSVADLYSVLAMAPGGPSFFMVEKGTPGLSSGKPEEKHGIRISNTTQVILENVEVPAENLVGLKEGEGISQAVAVFGYTRLMVAAFGLGAGESAIQCAIRYSKERKQFGKYLIEMQGYTHKLILPHLVRLEAARAYIEEIAERLDSGVTGLETEGAIAKLFATEAGNQAAEAAIQAHGGYGYTHEYEVEKIKRDVRITTIYEGTSEIMQQTIGKNRWREFLQSRGECYLKIAREMEAIEKECPQCGALSVAGAVKIMVAAFEYVREKRLTREQCVLFQMADMIAAVETGSALCKRAAQLKKASSGQSEWTRMCGRIYGAQVVSLIVNGVSSYLLSFGTPGDQDIQRLSALVQLSEIAPTYLGAGDEMNKMAALLQEK